jgi:hypothetical protein
MIVPLLLASAPFALMDRFHPLQCRMANRAGGVKVLHLLHDLQALF